MNIIKSEKNNGYKLLTWALIGFVIVFIVCAVSMSGSFSPRNPFYNCGEVSDVRIYQFREDIEQKNGYQNADGTVVLGNGSFSYTVAVDSYSKNWNYLCISLSNLTDESVDFSITYQKLKNDVITEIDKQSYRLYEGMNVLSLPGISFNRMQILVTGEKGCSFCIDELQFREKKPIFDISTILKSSFVTVILYLVISGFLYLIYRKVRGKIHLNLYTWIDALQEVYLSVIKRLKNLVYKFTISSKNKQILRRILFFIMFCYAMYVDIQDTYYTRFKYHIAFYIILLMVITILSIEESASKKNWNNALVWGWIVFCGLVCVSDFIIKKEPGNYRFFGYAMLLFIGLFIFVWNNMEHTEELITDFVKAIQAFFWFMVAYCMLFRPEDNVDRYSGFSRNPAVLALTLVPVWAIALCELEQAIRSEKGKRIIIAYLIEACLAFCFLWKSQSAGPLLCAAFLALVWFVRMAIYTYRHKLQKILVMTITCGILLLIPVYGVTTIGLAYIPDALGTTITYEDEASTKRTSFGLEVNASGLGEAIQETRLGKKFSSTTVTQLLAGRPYWYRTYLREINLFGHKDRPEMWGSRRLPHNEVLGIAYNYGIFTIVPYIVMLVAVLVRTFKHSRKGTKYAAVPFFICVSFVIMSLTDNVEQPFVWLPWIGMYLMMGSVFVDQDDGIIQSENQSES